MSECLGAYADEFHKVNYDCSPCRDAGSYGYLVEVEIPVEVRCQGKPLKIRLDAEKTGLAVYDRNGRPIVRRDTDA